MRYVNANVCLQNLHFATAKCESSQIIIVPATYNGNSVISVDAGAFKNDLNIKGIILPGSVVTIRNNAFYGCALLEVFSGIGVKRVDEQAFRGCTGVRCFATGILNEIGTGAFFDANIY